MSHMTQEFSDSCWVRKPRNLGNQPKFEVWFAIFDPSLKIILQVFVRLFWYISVVWHRIWHQTFSLLSWICLTPLAHLLSVSNSWTSTCNYSWWLSRVPFCLRMAHGRLAQFRQELRHDLALLAGSDQGLEGKWEWGWGDYSFFLICQVPRCSKCVDYSPVFTYMKGENWPHEQRGNGLVNIPFTWSNGSNRQSLLIDLSLFVWAET